MDHDALEDCIILAGLAGACLLLVTLLWWWLGSVGCLGALSGYAVGFAVYCSPLPEN